MKLGCVWKCSTVELLYFHFLWQLRCVWMKTQMPGSWGCVTVSHTYLQPILSPGNYCPNKICRCESTRTFLHKVTCTWQGNKSHRIRTHLTSTSSFLLWVIVCNCEGIATYEVTLQLCRWGGKWESIDSWLRICRKVEICRWGGRGGGQLTVNSEMICREVEICRGGWSTVIMGRIREDWKDYLWQCWSLGGLIDNQHGKDPWKLEGLPVTLLVLGGGQLTVNMGRICEDFGKITCDTVDLGGGGSIDSQHGKDLQRLWKDYLWHC